MLNDVEFMLESTLKILQAFPVTAALTLVSMGVGTILGLLIALARVYKVPVVKEICKGYISFIRGVPTVVLLYVVFFALPHFAAVLNQTYGWSLPVNIPSFPLAIIALAVDVSAYISEAIRSAFNSVSAGQMEAAYSIGMTRVQALQRIILPQVAVIALPPLENQFLILLRSTSLAYMIGVKEMMAMGTSIGNDVYRFVEVYIILAVIYWIICVIVEHGFSKMNTKIRFAA